MAEYPTWIPQQVVSRNTAPATRDCNIAQFMNLFVSNVNDAVATGYLINADVLLFSGM
jgi:hypothetical protein